jgi:quercetin dioxygenase-like cupin family protein
MQTQPWSLLLAAILFFWNVASAVANEHENVPAGRRIVAKQRLPRLDGNHLEMQLIEVTYRPGQHSKPHRHPCAVIGYVLEGAMRMKMQGKAETVYRAGESFYERPNELHLVSANSSATKPARFLACFVCDHKGPPRQEAASRQTAKGD